MDVGMVKADEPLRGFILERVLNDSPNMKSITLLGTYKNLAASGEGEEQLAIVILERLPFESNEIGDFFQQATTQEEVCLEHRSELGGYLRLHISSCCTCSLEPELDSLMPHVKDVWVK